MVNNVSEEGDCRLYAMKTGELIKQSCIEHDFSMTDCEIPTCKMKMEAGFDEEKEIVYRQKN